MHVACTGQHARAWLRKLAQELGEPAVSAVGLSTRRNKGECERLVESESNRQQTGAVMQHRGGVNVLVDTAV